MLLGDLLPAVDVGFQQVEVVAEAGTTVGTDTASLAEHIDGLPTREQGFGTFLAAPALYGTVYPRGIEVDLALQVAVAIVGVFHELLQHDVDFGQLPLGVGLEEGTIGTQLVAQTAEDLAGAVAAFDGLAVHVVVYSRGGGTEHGTDVDIDNGRVGVVAGIVHTELAAEVVGGTHDGAEVAVALLAGIGDLCELFGKHPEGEGVA